MTEVLGIVACGCNNHTTAATARMSTTKRAKEEVKAGKKLEEQVPIFARKEKKTIRTPPDKLYEDILSFAETGKVLISKNKNFTFSVQLDSKSLSCTTLFAPLTLIRVRTS